jgi:hypothetical protein
MRNAFTANFHQQTHLFSSRNFAVDSQKFVSEKSLNGGIIHKIGPTEIVA